MSITRSTKMTARQFEMLGEDPPGIRLELVEGEVKVSPSPRPSHSYVNKRLSTLLVNHIGDRGILLGDVDTIFGEYDVRRPDILYFTAERAHLIHPDAAIDGPPDLCVEIVSPSSGTIDRKDKFRQYAKGGVPYYWIVDPERRSIEAFRLASGRYRACDKGSSFEVIKLPPFPDLEISLGELWLPGEKK